MTLPRSSKYLQFIKSKYNRLKLKSLCYCYERKTFFPICLVVSRPQSGWSVGVARYVDDISSLEIDGEGRKLCKNRVMAFWWPARSLNWPAKVKHGDVFTCVKGKKCTGKYIICYHSVANISRFSNPPWINKNGIHLLTKQHSIYFDWIFRVLLLSNGRIYLKIWVQAVEAIKLVRW